MNWWANHVQHTVDYAKAAKAKDRIAGLRAMLGLVTGVAQWASVARQRTDDHTSILAHGLMAEHVIGAKLLADRQPENDQLAVGVGLQLLARNADFQAMFFGAAIDGFPATDFRKLLGGHLEATANYIKDLAAGDDASFDGHVAAARKNAMELDQFTAKALLKPA
jgi:hypothetical protein